MKLETPREEAVVRDLLRQVNKATTEVAARLRAILADVRAMPTTARSDAGITYFVERFDAEAARLEVMGRLVIEVGVGAPAPDIAEELALLERAGVPAAKSDEILVVAGRLATVPAGYYANRAELYAAIDKALSGTAPHVEKGEA